MVKSIKTDLKQTISYRYIKAAFILYLLSSISPWALGPIMALGYKKTALYYNDIFFYLHFLYNGFIVLSLIGLLFLDSETENKSNKINDNLKNAFKYILIGTILNYSESVLWTKPHISINYIAFISSILLIVGLYYLWRAYKSINKKNHNYAFLLRFGLFMFLLKSILQLFQSIPVFASISYDLKSYFIIGYIHLVTLGFITPMLLSLYINNKLFSTSLYLKLGIYTYLIGFILTEFVLFGQGILLWFGNTYFMRNFNLYMLFSSAFLFIGLSLIYISSYKKIDLPA